MNILRIAFDIDGTLIDWNEKPNQVIVDLIKFFHTHVKNVEVILWSRRGEDWCKHWIEELELSKYIHDYGEKRDGWSIDIAFDDQHSFDLADKNIIVRLK